MSALQSLRNAHRLTRFVLVWLALFMGVAVASPILNPDSVQLVCTSGGSVKLVTAQVDGQDASDNGHGLHCPLCLPLLAPPAAAAPALAPLGQSHALTSLAQTPLASLIGLPWQARAPPSFS